MIQRRFRKVIQLGRALNKESSDEAIHELRLEGKKLRYTIDLFSPLFDRAAAKRLLKAMRQMQNTLGAFNDCSVQQLALIDALECSENVSTLSEAAFGALITLLYSDEREHRSRVLSLFSDFDTSTTRDLIDAMTS
jgi:CHAD domain-containing protein